VLTPLISQIQALINRQPHAVDILHIHHLIIAIGSLAKGFPDFNAAEKSVPSWHPLFRDALKFIIQILEKLQSQSLICEAVRYSLQRFVGCMGSDIMIDVLPVIKAGVLTGGSSGSSKDLIDFLSFLGVLMFKFKMDFYPIINEMIIPLHERSLYLINKSRLGTDDIIESAEVKRAYMSFLGALLNSELETALTSECNFFN
jgi:exportin-T